MKRHFAPLMLAAISLGAFEAMAAAAPPGAATEPSAAPALPAYVTRGQLEKVSYNSVVDSPGADGALIFPEVKTGILLPSAKVQEGDPVPAWLIVKSIASETSRGIPLTMDLGAAGGKPRFEGTARVELVQLKGETAASGEVVMADLKGKSTLSTKRVLLSAGDFFVNGGDLQNLAPKGKRPLPAGTYVLRFWAEGQKAEASFKISARSEPASAAPTTAPAPADQASHELTVMNWVGGYNGRPVTRGGQMRLTLRNGYLAPSNADDFRTGLSLGIGAGAGTRYYSRISDIPQQDETLGITVAYTPGKTQKLQITLTPRALAAATQAAVKGAGTTTAPAAAGETQIPAYLTIYLLVENMGPPTALLVQTQRQGGMGGGTNRFNVPLVIDAVMPPQWNNSLNFEGKARLSVIVSSDPVPPGIEQPGEADQQQRMNMYGGEAVRARGSSSVGKRWEGIVKSAPVDIVVKQTDSE